MQTKRRSRAEVGANVFFGYWINIAVQLVLYPAFGATFSYEQNVWIGLVFMAVSLIRGYTFRRFFNRGDGEADE